MVKEELIKKHSIFADEYMAYALVLGRLILNIIKFYQKYKRDKGFNSIESTVF